ncbi:MAG: hypothetical protein KJ583_02270 [Nanoarchaeota archaeon]|nr:hypothetical protein [Nanoarchaeota archaeon]MBU1269742.1 hypothetical protein [Nanoarchaeota archaeon]MBU1604120.1 hypothetical protein [Nanoarchaeota archaeon]MBU2443913.1 hypothetical protein [Nanoarchaeota archaeon]
MALGQIITNIGLAAKLAFAQPDSAALEARNDQAIREYLLNNQVKTEQVIEEKTEEPEEQKKEEPIKIRTETSVIKTTTEKRDQSIISRHFKRRIILYSSKQRTYLQNC